MSFGSKNVPEGLGFGLLLPKCYVLTWLFPSTESKGRLFGLTRFVLATQIDCIPETTFDDEPISRGWDL